MSICIIDNHDSFTFNLVQIIGNFSDFYFQVFKNDDIDIDDVQNFDKILFSPGPGLPSEAGKMNEIIKKFSATKSILGICLGHQAIAGVFGGSIYNLTKPLHGKKEEIIIDISDYLFHEIPSDIEVGLYHSWAVNENDLPSSLKIIAKNKDGLIMGLAHKYYDVRGLQFHPESVMTPHGEKIIENWLMH